MWISKLPCINKHIKLQSPIQVTTFCSLSITWCSQTCIERPQKTEKGSKHKRESYLCGPFSALTCSSMPQNLICISILSQLVCGSNTQRSLTWWALWVEKSWCLSDAELSNLVGSSMESVAGSPMKVKAFGHSCRRLISFNPSLLLHIRIQNVPKKDSHKIM